MSGVALGNAWSGLRYGALGFPLAFLALPLLFILLGVVRWQVRRSKRALVEKEWSKGGK